MIDAEKWSIQTPDLHPMPVALIQDIQRDVLQWVLRTMEEIDYPSAITLVIEQKCRTLE